MNARFVTGDTVWIKAGCSGDVLADDEATVIEDVGTGYIVLQDSEVGDSGGMGWFADDTEVESLMPALAAIA
jgi:hypothetical protein